MYIGHKEIADSLIGNEHFELNPISPSAKEMTIDMKSMKDRDSVTQKNWKRALKEAVSQNDEDTTEMLLKNYPNFTKGLQDPWPLHSAAEKGEHFTKNINASFNFICNIEIQSNIIVV